LDLRIRWWPGWVKFGVGKIPSKGFGKKGLELGWFERNWRRKILKDYGFDFRYFIQIDLNDGLDIVEETLRDGGR